MEEEKLRIKPSKIKEINIDGERIFLVKSRFFGWGIVKPTKIDGKINWKNFIAGGSWIKLALVFLFIIILLGSIYEYSIALKMANDCLASNRLFSLIN